MIATKGYIYGKAGIKGQLLCARQFMNSLDESSLEECKRAIEEEQFLLEYYEIGDKYIKSRDGMVWFSFAGLDRNIASIKSKGRILVCWVDEAEPVTDEAFMTLIPTLREEGEDWNAELWITWNPKRKNAAVEKRFLNSTDPRVKIVELNWRDNTKFPAKLERDRQRDLIERPEQYPHIWEGKHLTVVDGAYFASHLIMAENQGRILDLYEDPLFTIKIYCDIGGTGAKADAFTMWAQQSIGDEIRWLNYYEARGQELGHHLHWLRGNGYTPERTVIKLPHDGSTNDKVFAVSYQSAFSQVGYSVDVIPNQGRGAVKQRIEAARRLFPKMKFDRVKTQAGRDALGWYHEKIDEERGIGLGAEHDWSSHGADSFGMGCIDYEPPTVWTEQLKYPSLGVF
jgi:phage terminase large subunit